MRSFYFAKVREILFPMMIISLLFFVFGFITWLNASLIPFFKLVCNLNEYESYFVTFAFYISYFFMAIPASMIINKVDYQKSIILGLIITSIGIIIFVPASIYHSYYIFLLGLFMQGIGIVILQTAVNPYLTMIGSEYNATKRISIVGMFNKLAGIFSPILFTNIILTNNFNQNIDLNYIGKTIIIPYILMFIIVVILSIIVFYSELPKVNNTYINININNINNIIFKHPYFLYGVIALFCYVGAEVITVDTILLYSQWMQLNFTYMNYLPSLTLFFMILGYIFSIIIIPKYCSQIRVLILCSIINIVISIIMFIIPLSVFYYKIFSLILLSFLGLFNAFIWPIVWPLLLIGLKHHKQLASSILVMGISGGAIIPLIYGKISLIFNPQNGYIILSICYLIIYLFAIKVNNHNLH
ncbi:MAG: MFS transporter [Bacteroides sp.]|nr:MAG: MFS transporter [Bacteroides sp.]